MSCCIKGVAWEDSLAFLNIAWVQALQGFGRWARKGRRACNYVSEIWIVPPIPLLLPIDRAVRFLPISTKWKQARMRIVIEKHEKDHSCHLRQSAFRIDSMQIFKFQKHSCRLSFLFPPRCKAPQRACSQAILNTITGFAAKWHLRNVSADIPYWWHITAQNLGPVRIKFLQVTGPWNSDSRLVKMATKDIKMAGTWPSLQTAQ